MNIDRRAVARHIAEQIYGMGPIDAAERILSRLAPFFDHIEETDRLVAVMPLSASPPQEIAWKAWYGTCAAMDAHLAAIKGEAMSNDPPTTQAASPRKYHSPDYGRGHIEGWDAGFVRALDMAEYIARSHSHDSNVGDAITEAIRALRERKEGEDDNANQYGGRK